MHNTHYNDATQDPSFKAQTSALQTMSEAINRGCRLDAIERLVTLCNDAITTLVGDETEAKKIVQKAGKLAERFHLPMPNCLRGFPVLEVVFQTAFDDERS